MKRECFGSKSSVTRRPTRGRRLLKRPLRCKETMTRTLLLVLVAACCICIVGNGTAAAADTPAASPERSNGTCRLVAGVPTTTDVNPLAPARSELMGCGLTPGVGALCPLRLNGGVPASGLSASMIYHYCHSQISGKMLCVTCCTCVFIGSELDCQCATDCIEVF
jgi:hypothetical protein